MRILPQLFALAARMLWAAGSWLKHRDPPEAQRCCHDLLRRCRHTSLGQMAAAGRWFPKVEVDEDGITRDLAAPPRQ